MSQQNKKIPTTSTLAGRMALCVQKAGGKRVLATRTLISEAQLFRYLNNLSDVPAERIVSIAKAAGVSAGWLLTGEDTPETHATDRRPTFRPALMQYTARLLDELLVEYQRSFSPHMRAQLLTLIYEALRHEEILHGRESAPNKFMLLGILSFMEGLKNEEMLAVYHRVMTLLEYESPFSTEHHQLLNTFCRLTVAGHKSFFEAYAGEAYYERMGMELSVEATAQLDSWLSRGFEVFKRPNLRVLDLGCGNGRHLAYLHTRFPALQLSGVDVSHSAVELCRKLIARGKLAVNSVQVAECHELPHANASLDLVHARHVLHYQPYVPGTGLGLEAALAEIHRVLSKDGLLCLTHFHGHGREYSTFEQSLNPEMLETLATAQGFKILQVTVDTRLTDNPGSDVIELSPVYPRVMRAVLQKTA